MKKVMTLSFVCRDGSILLGRKKRGFGVGRWNGFGGKVHEEESIEVAAGRELIEEAGIAPIHMEQVGLLTFTFASIPDVLEVHVFKICDFEGEPEETEEMKPQWFIESEIPFDQMWSDDPYWFPHLLSGTRFEGAFHFDRPADSDYASTILTHEIHTIT